ncbi:MAG: hypothetical protein IT462_01990 [Planctomycetes bacterium]|nr:hypothetical protein [Planctomycetota bacterium]
MLGEQIMEETGKTIGRRVYRDENGTTLVEVSAEGQGKLLGVPYRSFLTYTNELREDGTLCGTAVGVVMSEDGSAHATFTADGLGQFKDKGRVSYRGNCYYQSKSPKWAQLSKVPVVFEYEVEADGSSKGKEWEWR